MKKSSEKKVTKKVPAEKPVNPAIKAPTRAPASSGGVKRISVKKAVTQKKIAVDPSPVASKPEEKQMMDVSAYEQATTQQKPFVGSKPKPEKYFEALGRRKRATARVRLYTSNPQNSAETGNIEINGKPYKTYFPSEQLFLIMEEPLKKLKSMNRFRATVKVSGGGTHAQAEAVRHGLSRALTLFDQNFRKRLKRAGFLKRDPREKERKKYGLKKARRRPQWAKR